MMGQRVSVYRTSSKRLNLMVPGSLVSIFVCCARYVERRAFEECAFSRMAVNGLYRVLAERSSGLEEILV